MTQHALERTQLRRIAFGLVAGVSAIALLAGVLTDGARANAAYPGSTLSLSLSGTPAAQMVTIVASGANALTDPMQIGPYNLQMFAKDAAIDATCANDWGGEQQALTADAGHEFYFDVGSSEGNSGPFTVPVKLNLSSLRNDWHMHGAILICAYSTWTYDTAASAQLQINPPQITHHPTKRHRRRRHRHHR